MKKLQYEKLNKGIELESKLMEQMDEYDVNVIDAMVQELENLEGEHEQLKLNGNVITEFNMAEYLQGQRRLKELPTLINDLHRDKLKAIEDKSKLKDSLCKGIYSDLGGDYRAEFNSNMETLINEYDRVLTKLIEINKQMEALEHDYIDGLNNVISTKGIYMTINRHPFISNVLEKHSLNQKSLNLYYAK